MSGHIAAFGKLLIGAGILCIVAGIVLLIAGKVPFFGKLPGDILVKKDNFVFYFPLATSIILSIILTIFFNIILKR